MRLTSIALCAGLCLGGLAGTAVAEPAADGKVVFVEQKCTKCHSAPGIAGGKADLAGVGKKRTAEWMTKWLKKEEQIDGKKHKKAFTGTPAQLEAVVKWLSSLR
jgi:mono/diheme cytochrome c family protein